jgi:16S rRNA (guanine(966)-N(2))-methyltransferase RsmD
MRIITGKYKGRVIKIPKDIRPTQNKVRKAVFDILGDLEGLSFLELYAGSGAIGLEALSQGAREAVFVEKNIRCCEVIKGNLKSAGLVDVRVFRMDALEAVEKLSREGKRFDIIFFDPPYYSGTASPVRGRSSRCLISDGAKKTLQTLSQYDILSPNGFIIAQHLNKDNLPAELGVLHLFRQAQYGDTVLSLYKRV